MPPPQTVTIKDGRLSLPEGDLSDYGLQEGDELLLVNTKEGVLIGTRLALGKMILDKLADGLQESGTSLEQIMQDGDNIRENLIQEKYSRKEL